VCKPQLLYVYKGKSYVHDIGMNSVSVQNRVIDGQWSSRRVAIHLLASGEGGRRLGWGWGECFHQL